MVPHVYAEDIRVREIELARALRRYFEVYCLKWTDASHGISGGPVRRRWLQWRRAAAAFFSRTNDETRRDGLRLVEVPVLQPILLRRLVGEDAALRLSRRWNGRGLERVAERLRITHLLLSGSIFGIPRLAGVRFFYDIVDWFAEEKATGREMRAVRAEIRALAARADGFFVVSEPLAEKLRQEYALECTVLPNGADLTALRRVPASDSEALRERWNSRGKYVIGYIGNHAEFCGVDFAERAFQLVRKKMPDAVLWIVGPAEYWRPRLEGSPGVIFTGGIPPSQIAPYFHAIDLGLLAKDKSALTEFAFHLKVVEYSACRKLVVSTPLETWRRLAWPNVRLVEPDPAEWAAAIIAAREANWLPEWDKLVDAFDWSALAERAAAVMLGRD
ncbi:MAG TPA: glycosyltransferase family 4 protein [Candidatus Acidoferrales bacterium]|nr:glycosyltransferase family 4 protein [Candidatus Acidoferrales bacterium]